jgi:hypothetical protein
MQLVRLERSGATVMVRVHQPVRIAVDAIYTSPDERLVVGVTRTGRREALR